MLRALLLYALFCSLSLLTQATEHKLTEEAECNFSNLDETIQSAKEGDTITLKCAQPIIFEEYIVISKSLTIKGLPRVTFDGQNRTRFFVIAQKDFKWGAIAKDISVTISSVNFINGYGNDLPMGRRGGCQSNGCWGDASMSNPILKKDGGAIYLGSEGTLNVDNSMFANCHVYGKAAEGGLQPNDISYQGGAILVSRGGKLQIRKCIFKHSSAKGDGGCIMARWRTAKVTIVNTEFNNCSAWASGERGGGAIKLHETELIMKASRIRNSRATLGAAIHCLLSDMTIEGTTFRGNIAKDPQGVKYDARGSIYIDGARAKTDKKAGLITFRGNIFFENYSAQKGGALYACPYKDSEGDVIDLVGNYFCGNVVEGKELVEGQHRNLNHGAGVAVDCSGRLRMTKNVFGRNQVKNKEVNWMASNEQFVYTSPPDLLELGAGNIIPAWQEDVKDKTCPQGVIQKASSVQNYPSQKLLDW